MESLLGKGGTAPLEERIECRRNLGWIVTNSIEDVGLDYAFNCAVRVKQMDTTHHGVVQIVDLRLSNGLEDPPDMTVPQITGEELRFDCTTFGKHVCKDEVYMLVGAKILLDLQRERCLRFPPTTENTATILLPSREDVVATMMEMFSGGMGSWAEACRALPAECAMRVDNEGMAISSTLLNQANTVLYSGHGDQASFNTFWGEIADLRWTIGLHSTNTEFVCSSPPCGAYLASGLAPGLQDAKATVGWLQMILVMRFLQRRALIIEALPGFAKHEDFQTIRSLLVWAGYRIIWHGFISATGLMPAEQQRFFMVAWNAADTPSVGMPFRMMQYGPRQSLPCEPILWKNMPGEVLTTVKLVGTDITKVTSRELLPKYLQPQVGSPIHIRLVNQQKPLPLIPGNYRVNLQQPWVILKKRGLHIPLLYQGADIRVLSKWEILRAYGFGPEYILPDNEEDALAPLGQCLMLCLAVVVLGSALAHRQEEDLSNQDLVRYLDAAIEEWEAKWDGFQGLTPFNKNGWAMLVTVGDVNATGPRGKLTRRLQGLQVEIDALTYGRAQGRNAPFLPESSRVLYEDMEGRTEELKTHKLFHVEHGYHYIVLDDDDTVAEVNRKVAEFLQIPEERLAIAKLTEPTKETENWIIAGEVPSESYGKVLVLVDPAIPAAWWMTSEVDKTDFRYTYADQHAAPPDFITINDSEIVQWPASLQSGDYIRLRWNHSSEAEAWKELDIFKGLDEPPQDPPASPAQEGGESSPGGSIQDPPDGDHGGAEVSTALESPPQADPSAPDPPPTAPATSDDVPPTVPYNVELEGQTRGLPFHDAMGPNKRRCTPESHDLRKVQHTPDLPSTINYGSIQNRPSVDAAFYVLFQNQIVSFNNQDGRTLEQLVQDEWGLPDGAVYFTLGVKVLGPHTQCCQIPVGATVVTRGRLRGGTGQVLQKLRAMLASKGVPDDQLENRIQEIRSQIGDKGIKEAYTSFDPWANLKAKCTNRIIKETETKHKPKSKEVQDELVDPLQIADPWSQALKERGAWKLDNTFFKLEDGNHPTTLDKLAHGACGIAIISEKEAEILMQSQETMSDYELAALVVGSSIQSTINFPVKNVETPCRNKDNVRILVRAQLINFGKKTISLAGEANVVTVEEIDASVLACEMVRAEMDDWEEMTEGTIRYLKSKVETLDRSLIGSWGRKYFIKSKQTTDTKHADTCFIMLRIKRECLETILKHVQAGVYFSPRRENGTLDSDFKVIWMPDKPLQELLVKVNSEATAFGLVRNKTGHGIRVRSAEFSQLRQKWQPTWTPIENTPYNIRVQQFFDLQNMPLSCTKTEVQKFVNAISWKALVLRQSKPRTWAVGAEGPPEKLVHLTSHGTVLISEQPQKGGAKGKATGKGKQAKGASSWWVAGPLASPSSFGNQQLQANPQAVMIMDKEAADLEDKLQKKIDQYHKVIESQKADFSSKLTTSQISLKEELMGEMRNQMGAIRKRHSIIRLDDHLDWCKQPTSNNYRLEAHTMQRGFVDDGMQAGKRSPSANYYNSFYHSWNTFYLGDILLPMPMFSGERVGEASNPGPDFFTVSGTNAQSLNAFCDDGRLTSPHAEVLVYTETAATEFVQIKAKKLAHAANQHAVFSKAVRKRSFQDGRDCNTKGEAKGSAIVSKCPVRPTFSAWSTEAWDTARINDCYLITDSGNVLVIAMYGLHQGLPNAEEANQVRCPALIVGDLNCDLQQLNAWHAMVQAGWSDAALVQQQLDGLPAANTYKDVSRLDYVLMNDLARFAFRRFYLSPQDEADHRTVNAEFDWSGIPKQCKTFRMPLDAAQLDIPVAEMQHAYIPAKALDILDIAIRKGDIEEAWGAFCKAYEDGISFAMDKLGKRPPKTFLGRGTTRHQVALSTEQFALLGCLVSPSSNPDEILKAAEDYWKGYWNAEMVTQMDDEMVQ
ncbi:unnamed protein product, partial [Symbiodinium microadriaticum]